MAAGVGPRSFVQVATVLEDGTAYVTGDYPATSDGSVPGLVKDHSSPSASWALVNGMPVWALPSCEGADIFGYTVPVLDSWRSSEVSKAIANGTLSATASCSFGSVSISSETASCDSGFVPAAGHSCVADVCQSSVPNSAVSTATSQTVSWAWHFSETPGQCTFACAAGHSWNGSSCRASCPTPATAQHSGMTYALSSISNISDGQNHSLSWTASFGVSPANGTLTANFAFSCNDGTLSTVSTAGSGSCQPNYTWNGQWSLPTCAANARTFHCATKPPTGTVWNSVSSYQQTWNGSGWAPADSATIYSLTASDVACFYRCDAGYGWNAGTSSCALSASGACGTANGTAVTSAPSLNLCLTGPQSAVSGTGPWNWTCSWINWGAEASCSAPLASHTVTFHANGWSWHSPTTKSVLHGSQLGNLPPTNPTQAGHSFVGWFTQQSGGTQVTTANVVTAPITFYAQWVPNTYSVSGWFWANGAWATVSACGYTATATSTGAFAIPWVPPGTKCDNVTATREGYQCTTSNQGPNSLTANFTTVSGSCAVFTCWDSIATGGHTYTTLVWPDGKCWTKQNMRHSVDFGTRTCWISCPTEGAHYNFIAANNVCSRLWTLWKLPSESQWTALTNAWATGWTGNKLSGIISQLPGWRDESGSLQSRWYDGLWWSSTPNPDDHETAWAYILTNIREDVQRIDVAKTFAGTVVCTR